MPARFSLVLATLDATPADLVRFLDSLLLQEYPHLDLIVVDQNPDDRLVAIVRGYRDRLDIMHLRSAPGLSRARNVGLGAITGDLVAFPDDDCWYPAGLLARVNERFSCESDWAGISGRVVDERGAPSAGKWDTRAGAITRFNVWNRGVSVSLFLRRAVLQAVGDFDETLGAGAGTAWASGEETDYLLRAMKTGFHLQYQPDLGVGHPGTRYEGDDVRSKAYRYALGMGRVLRKHRYPLWFVLSVWLRTAAAGVRALVGGNLAKGRYGWAILAGRIRGYLTAS
jgi:glycosyltransferase involved in cell wall biosynthesis